MTRANDEPSPRPGPGRLVLSISMSSDVASNPEVTWSNNMSLMSDICDKWFHADCQGIGSVTFDILFREKRSCETQLIEFVHDIAFNMQEGIQNDVVVMDFAKAFDKVAHNRLLYKLSSYGVMGNIFGWIGSFLSGRSQKVVLEGKSSSSVPVLSAFRKAQFWALYYFS